jgi:signal transduction histidine kinase/DNA-binding response OmpR family regulator
MSWYYALTMDLDHIMMKKISQYFILLAACSASVCHAKNSLDKDVSQFNRTLLVSDQEKAPLVDKDALRETEQTDAVLEGISIKTHFFVRHQESAPAETAPLAIAVSENGALWKVFNNRLLHQVGSSFITYELPNEIKGSLLSSKNTSLFIRNGQVVLGLNQYIYVFDSQALTLKLWHTFSDSSNHLESILNYKNRWWLLTKNKLFQSTALYAELTKVDLENKSTEQGNKVYTGMALVEGSGVWVASSHGQLANIRVLDTNHLDTRNFQARQHKSSVFLSIAKGKRGELLIGTQKGLLVFSLESLSFQKLAASQLISSITQIKYSQDQIFFTSLGGLYVLSENQVLSIAASHFIDLKSDSYRAEMLTENATNSLLVQIHGDGLFRYTKHENIVELVAFQSKPLNHARVDSMQAIDGIGFVVSDGTNTIVSSTDHVYSKGFSYAELAGDNTLFLGNELGVFKAKNSQLELVFEILDSYISKVNSISITGHLIWVTTELSGLSAYDLDSNQMVSKAKLSSLSPDDVMFASKTESGELVLVYKDKIEFYTTTDVHFIRLVRTIQLNQSVTSVRKSRGQLVLIEDANNVSFFDLSRQVVNQYNFSHGSIHCIAADRAHLWALYKNGTIERITKKDGTAQQISNEQVLLKAGVIGSWCEVDQGNFYFNTQNGIARTGKPFNNASLEAASLNIFDSSNQTIFKNMKVKHDEFPLQITVLQSSSIKSNRVKTAYRVNETGSWIEERDITLNIRLPQLGGGRHILDIKAINHLGVESGIRQVSLFVEPPWYLTVLAKLVYVLLCFGCIWLLIRWRLWASKKQQAILETQVKMQTSALQKEKVKVSELLASKQRQLANVSHEFRTPLTLIIGPIQEMIRTTNNQKQVNQLQTVEKSAFSLLRMVEQMLTLESVKSRNKSSRQVFDNAEAIRSITRAFEQLFKQRSLQINLDLIPAPLKMDVDAFESVMTNLISNAIKYSKKQGMVTIESRVNNMDLVIQVKDQGIGIEPEQIAYIFDRFQRASTLENATVPGAGIGLSLVKEIVELYDGSVSVSSQVKLGSSFQIVLPVSNHEPIKAIDFSPKNGNRLQLCEIADSALIEQRSSQSKQNTQSDELVDAETQSEESILIIEDSIDMQQHIMSVLAARGRYQFYFACHGGEGIELAKENMPDLIISDVMMPKVDGFEMLQRLRQEESIAHIPCILLSAKSDQESIIQGLEQQANDYITKPFSADELSLKVKNTMVIRSLMQRKLAERWLNEEVKSKSNIEKETVKTTVPNDNSTIENYTEIAGKASESESVEAIQNKVHIAFLKQLDRTLEVKYQDCELKIESIADEMRLSQRQLLRKLKSALNMTPAEYLRRYRLKAAAHLLEQGHPPSYVYLETGFSSHTHFGKCFKAQYSLSPSEYLQTVL